MHYVNEVDNPTLSFRVFALNQSQNTMLKRKLSSASFFGRETTHTGNMGKCVFHLLPTNLLTWLIVWVKAISPTTTQAKSRIGSKLEFKKVTHVLTRSVFHMSKSTDTWNVKIPFETYIFTDLQLGHRALFLSAFCCPPPPQVTLT